MSDGLDISVIAGESGLTEHNLSILPEGLFWTGMDDFTQIPALTLPDDL